MSSKVKKRSWKKRTIAMSSNGSGPSGIGVPSASPIASRGMSTPAPIVSGIVPGKRALTSSRAGSPSAAPLTCTFATVVSPISLATSRA